MALQLSCHSGARTQPASWEDAGRHWSNWPCNTPRCVRVNWRGGINIPGKSFTCKTFSITGWRQSDSNYSTYPSACQPQTNKMSQTRTHAHTHAHVRTQVSEDAKAPVMNHLKTLLKLSQYTGGFTTANRLPSLVDEKHETRACAHTHTCTQAIRTLT